MLFLQMAPSAMALTESQMEIFSQNNILFYDPNANQCETTSVGSGNSDGSDVYLIGDSISVHSENEIKSKLPKITIDALSGTYFSHDSEYGKGGTERIASMGSQDILVFAMGTNGGIDSMYSDDTEKLLAALAGKNVQVILMTIFYNGFSTDQMNTSNSKVKELASQNTNITYFDWNAAVSGNPSNYVLSDGIHPTDNGKTKFAELIRAAVNKVTKMTTSSSSSSSSSGSGYDRLKNAVREYGEFAMQMQIEYGTPWEVVLAQMQIESQVGTAGHAVNGAENNWLGITGSGDAGYWTSPGGRKWAKFSSVEKSIEAWAGQKVLRNGFYDDAFPYLDINNWDLHTFLVKMISHYAPSSDGNDESRYVSNIISLINGPIKEVREEMGWPSSEDWARQNNIPVGGKYPIGSDIASGGGGSYGSSSDECRDSNGSTSGGVTFANINGYNYAFPIAGATKANYLRNTNELKSVYSEFGNVSVLSAPTVWYHHTGACTDSDCNQPNAADMGIATRMTDIGDRTAQYYISKYGSSGAAGDTKTYPYYASSGAKVVAAIGGTLHWYNESRNGASYCSDLKITGDDGHVWYYIHILRDDSLYSRADRRVEAGEVIAEIGTPECADNTQSHLHFMIDGSSSPINIATFLNPLFNALPADAAELAAREASSGEGEQPVGNIFESSTNISCNSNTTDVGVFTGYHSGSTFQIRLCALDKPGYQIKSSGAEETGSYGVGYNKGYALVNSRVSGAFAGLAHRYYEQKGTVITATSSYRTNSHQQTLYNTLQKGQAAKPGYSNHQAGLAVDFSVGCSFGTGPSACTTDMSKWLGNNIADFGLKRSVATEAWHVSPE